MNDVTEKVCALTGHRELPENFDKNELYDTLEELIKEGYTYFCCGMANGFDLTALECLVDLKQRYHVRVEACIPFEGYDHGAPQNGRDKYSLLLPWCDVKTVLSPSFFNGCFLARDRYMVEKADILLAYCTKDSGGSVYTVRYAVRCGKRIRLIGNSKLPA